MLWGQRSRARGGKGSRGPQLALGWAWAWAAAEHAVAAACGALAAAPPVAAAPLVAWIASGAMPVPRIEASTPVLAIAGLLVGFGSVWGSGCTSGHGVCGLSRLSPRSLVATMAFMATGMATVFVVRHLG